MNPKDPFEFYETPRIFTNFLFSAMDDRGTPIDGELLEPCVGDSAIIKGWEGYRTVRGGRPTSWVTNDIDTRWKADTHKDARNISAPATWWVSNPPFTLALPIIARALSMASVGVAMHLRASIHEVLKNGVRRTWMARNRPTGILWLPRFAYQRSKTTGLWTTDTVCACWVIWLKDPAAPQFIDYAPEWVLDGLARETPDYRRRMDLLTRGEAA